VWGKGRGEGVTFLVYAGKKGEWMDKTAIETLEEVTWHRWRGEGERFSKKRGKKKEPPTLKLRGNCQRVGRRMRGDCYLEKKRRKFLRALSGSVEERLVPVQN